MKQEYFEIVKLALNILLILVTVVLTPKIKEYLTQNLTDKQRQEALFWIRQVTKIAENIYKEKGQGVFKKEYVVKWLNDNKISLTEEQLDILIEMVVAEYNKQGWNKDIN